jgi:hypothetical protein
MSDLFEMKFTSGNLMKILFYTHTAKKKLYIFASLRNQSKDLVVLFFGLIAN